ncbi:MAG: hypothetical protein M1837_003462 [Sclerophora amabilis]|nr:MAG: hypothetical protein M1837_003462 [Sclerophora amabilis]
MDVYYGYSYSSAAWLAIQAGPLIISPTMIIAMLSPEVRAATMVEVYLSRSLGFALLTIALLSIILTGSIPLTSSLSESSPGDHSDPTAPYAVPILTITLIYQSGIAFYCYTRWASTDSTVFGLSTVGYGSLAALGLWCLLFASSSGRMSKKTGADKRTSGWPFGNSEADKKRKR